MFTRLPRLPRSVTMVLAGAAFPRPWRSPLPRSAPCRRRCRRRRRPRRPPPAGGAANGAMTVVVAEVKGTVQVSTDDGKTWAPGQAGHAAGPGGAVPHRLPQQRHLRHPARPAVHAGEPGDGPGGRGGQGGQAGQDRPGDEVRGHQLPDRGGGAEHESTIRTPGSTLSVRGTVVRVTDRAGLRPDGRELHRPRPVQDRPGRHLPRQEGRRLRPRDRRPARRRPGGPEPDGGGSRHRPRPHRDRRPADRPADFAGRDRFVRHPRKHRRRHAAAPGRCPTPQLAASLPGPLDFVLRWTGNADLNLLSSTTRPVTAGQHRPRAAGRRQPTPALGSLDLSDLNLGQVGILNSVAKLPAAGTAVPRLRA